MKYILIINFVILLNLIIDIMRAIWSGAIGFGLVNIPIKLYSASEDSKLDLDMLDSSDHSNIKFKRVNEKTGEEVEWKDIVKAYKLDDAYVVLDDSDFDAVAPEKSKVLKIEQFVDIDEIDTALYETPYFLEPAKNGEDAYNLLLHSLIKTKMVGVGTFILREKEILGLIRPYQDEILMVNRLRFPEELRSFEELEIKSKKPKKEELEMAVNLIEQLKKSFDPKKYENKYAEQLLEIIKAKAAGKTPKTKKTPKKTKETVDLMAQLKASLKQSKAS